MDAQAEARHFGFHEVQVWILLPYIFLTGIDSRSSMPSRHLTLIAHPSKGSTPSSNSRGVGSLGRLKGKMPHLGQK
jgi:hypothetical protein